MQILFRILIPLLLLGAFEFYFLTKVKSSIKTIFNPTKKQVNAYTIIGLIYYNIVPILAMGFFLYMWLMKSWDMLPPQNIFYDYLINYPFWIITIIAAQATLFFLTLDIVKLLLFPIYKRNKEKIKVVEAKVVFVILLLTIFYVPGRIVYDLNSIEIRNIEYLKKGLPKELEGLKITLISDVQADWYTNSRRLSQFVQKVNSTKPDLVLIAGDVITSSPNYIEIAAETLGKIESKYGVFSCVGDHDNWAYRFDNARSILEVKAALEKKNIPMIDNNIKVIKVGESKIEITFATNTYVGRIKDDVLDRLVESSGQSDIKIFLTHQPRQFLINRAVEGKYDLFFAGHTHGGQITFLYPFSNISITQLETKYVRGDFWFDEMLMVVTSGLGVSIAPIRYNATPEITTISLYSD